MPRKVANAIVKKPRGRPFPPGNNANPLGRPKGSRNRLAEDFLTALSNDFAAHGEAAIRLAREERPAQYLQIVASLMPKDLNVNMDASQAFVETLKHISGER